jgi:hypothetical protein
VIDTPSSNCTIESLQWLTEEDGGRKFLLSKRENDIIDVCSATPHEYLFSIDASFETTLNTSGLSTDLQQAFRDQNQGIKQNSKVASVSWYITDNDQQKHYLITREEYTPEAHLKVYRQYRLPLLRIERLSANILICIFDGILQAVDLHLKPETMHFGIDKDIHNTYSKKLKAITGDVTKLSTTILWNNQNGRVIDIKRLANTIKEELKIEETAEFSSAEFALEMIESPEKVRFSLV